MKTIAIIKDDCLEKLIKAAKRMNENAISKKEMVEIDSTNEGEWNRVEIKYVYKIALFYLGRYYEMEERKND